MKRDSDGAPCWRVRLAQAFLIVCFIAAAGWFLAVLAYTLWLALS